MLARVVVVYRNTILDVAHLRRGQRFTIGDHPAATLIVSHASLPDSSLFEVVRVTDQGVLVGWGTPTLLQDREVAKLELGDLSLHVGRTRAESLQLGHHRIDWGLIASMTTTGVIAAVFALLMRLTPEIEQLDPSPAEPAYARYLRPPPDLPPEPRKPSPASRHHGSPSAATGK